MGLTNQNVYSCFGTSISHWKESPYTVCMEITERGTCDVRGEMRHQRPAKVNMSQCSCSQIIPGQSSAIGLILINLPSFSSYSFLVVAL